MNTTFAVKEVTSMELKELREQPVELLPRREALGRSRGSVTITKIYAENTAKALNLWSDYGTASAVAVQTIVVGH
jgi:hypothetical protein